MTDTAVSVRLDPRPAGGLRALMEQTAADHRIGVRELMAGSRARPVVRARHDFMWRARQIRRADGSHRYSLPFIAAALGGMDHTSVRHGVLRHEQRLAGEAA